jgi:hypothetical protein
MNETPTPVEPSYNEMVSALVKDGNDIRRSLTPVKCDMWHMASCIPSEIAELMLAVRNNDRLNALEELGDLEFYTTHFGHIVFGGVLDRPATTGFSHLTMVDLVIAGGELFDCVKKHVIYEQELLVNDTLQVFLRVRELMRQVRKFFGFTLKQVRDANREKLGARYAKLVYSNDSARERADKAIFIEEPAPDVQAESEIPEPPVEQVAELPVEQVVQPIPVPTPVVKRPKRTVEYPTTLW